VCLLEDFLINTHVIIDKITPLYPLWLIYIFGSVFEDFIALPNFYFPDR